MSEHEKIIEFNSYIDIVKHYLKQEANTKLANEMSAEYKKLLCVDFCENRTISCDDVVGYFEDYGKLFSTFIGAISSKPSKCGIVFLKDRFVYRKNISHFPIEVFYEIVLRVEQKLSKTVIYTDENNSITLEGLSYSETSKISCMLQEIRRFNGDELSINKMHKIKKIALKSVGKITEFLTDELTNALSNAEKVIANSDKYDDATIEKAEHFIELAEKTNNAGYDTLSILEGVNSYIEEAEYNLESESQEEYYFEGTEDFDEISDNDEEKPSYLESDSE